MSWIPPSNLVAITLRQLTKKSSELVLPKINFKKKINKFKMFARNGEITIAWDPSFIKTMPGRLKLGAIVSLT